jgi:hypothetical protein
MHARWPLGEIGLLVCLLSIVLGGAAGAHAVGEYEQPAATQTISGGNMPDQSDHPAPSHPAPKGAPRPLRGTFVERLETAPYPYDGRYGDSDQDFFDHVDPVSGERFHTNRYELRLAEKAHYRDNSVLFHVPKQFDPGKPLIYVVFFHAIKTDINKSNRDHALARQVEASGRNVILVMPQLAKDAPDSSAGKFFQGNAFRGFMTEAAEVLTRKLGESCRGALARAPIVLAAFSGGYKATAYVLDRGGLDERIIGVLLLDALYEDVDKFQRWIQANSDRVFFVSIYGQGECEVNTRVLARQLNRLDLLEQPVWPGKIRKGGIHFVESSHEHLSIPRLGPPPEPIRALLRSIEPE